MTVNITELNSFQLWLLDTKFKLHHSFRIAEYRGESYLLLLEMSVELILGLVVAAFLTVIPLVQVQLLLGLRSFFLFLTSQAYSIATSQCGF